MNTHADTGAIACGLDNGQVVVLDLRTGLVRRSWRAHDAKILAVSKRVLSPSMLLWLYLRLL